MVSSKEIKAAHKNFQTPKRNIDSETNYTPDSEGSPSINSTDIQKSIKL